MGDTKYKYDVSGNLTNVDYPSGTTDLTFTYDLLNRVTNMVDAAGTTKYTYYAGGQLKTEDGPWSSDTVSNVFNSARLRSDLILQQPTGTWTNRFAYDAAHRLTSVNSKAGAFSYDYRDSQPSTLIKKLSLPNTSYITNDYDSMGRLLFTKLNNSSHSTLNSHTYQLNVGNQRTKHTRTDNSHLNFSYDDIGELTVVRATNSSNALITGETKGYAYDAGWNLARRTNNSSGSTTTFKVDHLNALTNVAGVTFSSDDNGNLTNYLLNGSDATATFDAENQLAMIEIANSDRSVFTYDGRGRLRQREDYTWGGDPYYQWFLTTTVRYVYDGMRVIQERNEVNTPQVSYTRGSDLSGTLEGAGGIGGLLARSTGYSSGTGNWSTHYGYHADGGGNVTYLVSSSQTLGASYKYDAYGNLVSSSGGLASANVYRFSSKEFIPTWNLYYYGYRFYDPNLQRWLNRDPIGDEAFINHREELQMVRMSLEEVAELMANLYSFDANDPLNDVDPFGLQKVKPCRSAWMRNCNEKCNKLGMVMISCTEVGFAIRTPSIRIPKTRRTPPIVIPPMNKYIYWPNCWCGDPKNLACGDSPSTGT